MWKFPVHVFNGGKIHGSILANRRMRTAAYLDAHNTLRRQRLSTRENELVFLRINVVSNDVDVVVVPVPLAQRFNERCLAGANWAADADTQRAVMTCAYAGLAVCGSDKSHERKSLVYCARGTWRSQSVSESQSGTPSGHTWRGIERQKT